MKHEYATTFVTHRQWELHLKRIMKQNLKNHGHTPSGASMRGGDIIAEIQDDKNGMLVIENWRDELNTLYLIPTQSDQDLLQETLVSAVERTRKTKRQMAVVRFVNRQGGMRYKIYPSHPGRGFRDCKIGERIDFLGYTMKHDYHSNDPLPFWPQSDFIDEYHALPLRRDYEISIYGKPYAEWCKDKEAEQENA